MPATVPSLRPRLSTVSIIPGMDSRAPERTDTSSGLSPSPKRRPMIFSTPAMARATSRSRPSG